MKALSPARHQERSEGLLAPAVRGITRVIPKRWRGAVLLVGVLILFPVMLAALIVDLILHDFRQAGARLGQWQKDMSSRRNSSNLSLETANEPSFHETLAAS